jgi:hypothetical protein
MAVFALSTAIFKTFFWKYQNIETETVAYWLKPLAVMEGRMNPIEIGLNENTKKKLLKRKSLAKIAFILICLNGLMEGKFLTIILVIIY